MSVAACVNGPPVELPLPVSRCSVSVTPIPTLTVDHGHVPGISPLRHAHPIPSHAMDGIIASVLRIQSARESDDDIGLSGAY